VRLVLDASVAAKWVVREADTDKAFRLKHPPFRLIAPDHLLAETANVVWKRFMRGEMPLEVVDEWTILLAAMNVDFRPSSQLVDGALQLACRHRISAYDALYVHLALIMRAPLVTVDEPLIAKLRSVLPENTLVHLRDLDV
jgi:predicted nucleic acid-binding protein